MNLCRSQGSSSSVTDTVDGDLLNMLPNISQAIGQRDVSSIDPIHGVGSGNTKIVVLQLQS
jgi:hypothetical protein